MKSTSALSGESKPTRTPSLRFPDFRDDLGWEETPLNAVLIEHGEKDDGASEVHSVSVHKGVINQVEHLGRSFAAADRSNYNLAKPYDVIYTKSPTGEFPWGVVKHNHLPYNVIVSPLYGVFSPVNQHLGYIFDAYFESPIRTTNYLAPITQKGAKNTIQISNSTFLSKGIYLPKLEGECQKIAECLGSLGKLIGAEREKLDVLKAYKKALMEQLFPREGETVPRLRFPEFQGAGEWEHHPLKEITVFVKDRISVSDVNRANYASTENLMPDFGGISPASSIPVAGNVVSYQQNDILVANIRPYLKKIWLSDKNGGASNDVIVIRAKPEIKHQYLSQVLKNDRFVAFVMSGAKGLKMPRGDTALIREYSVPTPKIREQSQIAACLFMVDDMVDSQSELLETLQVHKQGLMQQVFPSLEKSTGL